MKEVVARWKQPLLAFAVGQPAIQLLNLATGFFLLRWMTVEHYAQFGVAFAFQCTVAMLADLGFSSSILALAGTRAKDPEVLGRYMRSARHYRMILVVVVGFIFAACFPLITASHGWSVGTKFSLLTSILVAVCVQGWSLYNAPLLAHRQVASLYRPQITASSFRLVTSGLFHLVNCMNGVAASWLGTMALAMSGMAIRHRARGLIKEPLHADPIANREMIRYLAPLMPGVVFTAFQSQIQIAIITFFGSTQNIAEVAALGRLGQLFGILAAFNGVIIGPYVAGLPASHLRRRYFVILAATMLIAVVLAVFSFAVPAPLLWLLGPRYSNLGPEVGWVVLGSSLSYVGGVMWTMHAARKWVFWWATATYIGTLVAVQIVAVIWLDLSSTRGVVFFGAVTSAAVVIVQIFNGAYGFISDSRKS